MPSESWMVTSSPANRTAWEDERMRVTSPSSPSIAADTIGPTPHWVGNTTQPFCTRAMARMSASTSSIYVSSAAIIASPVSTT